MELAREDRDEILDRSGEYYHGRGNLCDGVAIGEYMARWKLSQSLSGVLPARARFISLPPTLTRRRVWYSSSDFWGLVQNSGKPIRIVPCDLEK